MLATQRSRDNAGASLENKSDMIKANQKVDCRVSCTTIITIIAPWPPRHEPRAAQRRRRPAAAPASAPSQNKAKRGRACGRAGAGVPSIELFTRAVEEMSGPSVASLARRKAGCDGPLPPLRPRRGGSSFSFYKWASRRKRSKNACDVPWLARPTNR